MGYPGVFLMATGITMPMVILFSYGFGNGHGNGSSALGETEKREAIPYQPHRNLPLHSH